MTRRYITSATGDEAELDPMPHPTNPRVIVTLMGGGGGPKAFFALDRRAMELFQETFREAMGVVE